MRCIGRAVFVIGLLLTLDPVRAGEPASKDAEELARYDARIKPKDRQHWAFQQVRSVAVPRVQDASWVRNPIDQFIPSKLEVQGWKPSPAAEPGALLRRMCLDLLGMPPTP